MPELAARTTHDSPAYVSDREAAFLRDYIEEPDTPPVSPRIFLPIETAVGSKWRPSCRYCGHYVERDEPCIAFGFDKHASADVTFAGRMVRAYIHLTCNGREDA